MADCNQESWENLLGILSSLITFKTRADGKGWRDAFENMPIYMQRLGIEEDIKKLKVIHVAGTKGKGSTCAMVDSILRSCGYSVGLFTSPHLCDVRERIRINGQMVSKEVFQENFWWCHNKLKEAATDEVGMPGYFRFLVLLGLKIFLNQHLDAVILEVGIGGRLDATNVIAAPVVTGVTSLGFDHMELLGDTLAKIAGEKAGIFKPSVPALSVSQPAEAMEVLEERAKQVGTTLTLPPPLRQYTVEGQHPLTLGIAGAHQELNASLAVQLAATWEARAGVAVHPDVEKRVQLLQQQVLPAQYSEGLAAAKWPGRSQVIRDEELAAAAGNNSSGSSRLTLFLDGAHTPESMVTCAEWFAAAAGAEAVAAAAGASQRGANGQPNPGLSEQQQQQQQLPDSNGSRPKARRKLVRVLVFNCMKERDPKALLPELHASLQRVGWPVDAALFIPPDSQYAFLASSSTQQQAGLANRDVSWQQQLRDVWEACGRPSSPGEGLVGAGPANDSAAGSLLPALAPVTEDGPQQAPSHGAVLTSVAQTIDWLREVCKKDPTLQMQVLVTGSLYLVGDMLRALGKAPP